jgi:hypothetical protein
VRVEQKEGELFDVEGRCATATNDGTPSPPLLWVLDTTWHDAHQRSARRKPLSASAARADWLVAADAISATQETAQTIDRFIVGPENMARLAAYAQAQNMITRGCYS